MAARALVLAACVVLVVVLAVAYSRSLTTACNASSDCTEGRVCVNSVCTPPCDSVSCGAGFVCAAGVCEPAPPCEADADCPADQKCAAGKCVPAACVSNNDCPGGVCANGACALGVAAMLVAARAACARLAQGLLQLADECRADFNPPAAGTTRFYQIFNSYVYACGVNSPVQLFPASSYREILGSLAAASSACTQYASTMLGVPYSGPCATNTYSPGVCGLSYDLQNLSPASAAGMLLAATQGSTGLVDEITSVTAAVAALAQAFSDAYKPIQTQLAGYQLLPSAAAAIASAGNTYLSSQAYLVAASAALAADAKALAAANNAIYSYALTAG
jgi:hypothetical protein